MNSWARERSRSENSIIVLSIHGPNTTPATSTATILGTNVRVCSWICVVAWKMLITSPTKRPRPIIGPATSSTVMSASRPNAITAVSVNGDHPRAPRYGKAPSPVPLLISQQERADHDVPAVEDRKSTRLNSSHVKISYAVFCLKKKRDTMLE